MKWTSSQLSFGDKCDIQDSEQHWHLGQVLRRGTTKSSVRVLLLDAGPVTARDLTVSRSSPRLAGPGVHSAGQSTVEMEAQGCMCEELTAERLKVLTEQLRVLYPREQLHSEHKEGGTTMKEQEQEQGQEQGRSRDVWQETIQAVEKVLMCSCPPALVPTANAFLQGVLVLLARLVETKKAIEDAQLNLLQKLFFGDE